MLYTPVTKVALRICFDAHRDQVDKSGLPYVFHPFHLAEQMATEHEVCVALLHDVMEDTALGEEDLIAAGIPAAYVETCRLLTHDESIPYLSYVEALKDDPVARKVKAADLLHNSDLSRLNGEPTESDLRRREKYLKALALLREADEGTADAGGSAGVDEKEVRKKYERLTKGLIRRGLTITTMESCTSGQVASLITDTEGSSAVLKGAFVTYSNEAKVRQGVPSDVIKTYGVYSEQTAEAMAAACRDAYGADFGVGVTGSFGNVDPNNADSVCGEVFFAIARSGKTSCFHCLVPEQDSRLKYKLYMADVIADRLLSMIQH